MAITKKTISKTAPSTEPTSKTVKSAPVSEKVVTARQVAARKF